MYERGNVYFILIYCEYKYVFETKVLSPTIISFSDILMEQFLIFKVPNILQIMLQSK